ncbi:hypothetical protein V1511DRAFT_503731 [Dipodascopsis uninucleata]
MTSGSKMGSRLIVALTGLLFIVTYLTESFIIDTSLLTNFSRGAIQLLLRNQNLTHRTADVGELIVEKAWEDLQAISSCPHTYNSVCNAAVRAYLLKRIQNIVESSGSSQWIEIIDHSYGSGIAPKRPEEYVYFEGENIYVVIRGLTDSGAALASGHFDSVSTSFGTTDDGISITTLLYLLEKYSAIRPYRTIVLNFNSGEEISLFGSYQLIQHPVSQNISYFINLEGAGAGYRAAMFRSSNYQVLRAFEGLQASLGNVVMQDIFAAGIIHSSTDFTVYDANNMKGLDIAYYRPRSKYHTPLDNIKNTNRKSVKYMLDNADHIMSFISSPDIEELTPQNSNEIGVFFDVLGVGAVVLKFSALIKATEAVTIVGNITILSLIVYTTLFSKSFSLADVSWSRLPVMFLSLLLCDAIILKSYSTFNRDIIYSTNLPILAIYCINLGISLLVLYIYERSKPTSSSIDILLELFWTFSVLMGAVLFIKDKVQFGSIYILSLQYIGITLATALSLLTVKTSSTRADDLKSENKLSPKYSIGNVVKELSQFVVTCLPTYSVYLETLFFAIESLRFSVADGGLPTLPYFAVTTVSIVMILVGSPTLADMTRQGGHKIKNVSLLMLLTGTIVMGVTLIIFPFTESSPLKVFIQQSLSLDPATEHEQSNVTVVGIAPYVQKFLEEIPSARLNSPLCVPFGKNEILNKCTYKSLVTPSYTQQGKPEDWVNVSVSEVGHGSFDISIYGYRTRICQISIPKEIYSSLGSELSFEILSSPSIDNPGDKLVANITNLSLCSRIDLTSTNKDIAPFRVRISDLDTGSLNIETLANFTFSCGWDEMFVGRGSIYLQDLAYQNQYQMPPLEELMHYSPSWVTFQKYNHLLFQVNTGFDARCVES